MIICRNCNKQIGLLHRPCGGELGVYCSSECLEYGECSIKKQPTRECKICDNVYYITEPQCPACKALPPTNPIPQCRVCGKDSRGTDDSPCSVICMEREILFTTPKFKVEDRVNVKLGGVGKIIKVSDTGLGYQIKTDAYPTQWISEIYLTLVKEKPKFKVGDRVRVKNGMFNNSEGIIEEIWGDMSTVSCVHNLTIELSDLELIEPEESKKVCLWCKEPVTFSNYCDSLCFNESIRKELNNLKPPKPQPTFKYEVGEKVWFSSKKETVTILERRFTGADFGTSTEQYKITGFTPKKNKKSIIEVVESELSKEPPEKEHWFDGAYRTNSEILKDYGKDHVFIDEMADPQVWADKIKAMTQTKGSRILTASTSTEERQVGDPFMYKVGDKVWWQKSPKWGDWVEIFRCVETATKRDMYFVACNGSEKFWVQGHRLSKEPPEKEYNHTVIGVDFGADPNTPVLYMQRFLKLNKPKKETLFMKLSRHARKLFNSNRAAIMEAFCVGNVDSFRIDFDNQTLADGLVDLMEKNETLVKLAKEEIKERKDDE